MGPYVDVADTGFECDNRSYGHGWMGERVWGGSLVPKSAGMQLGDRAMKVIRQVLLSADKDFMTGDGLTGVRS